MGTLQTLLIDESGVTAIEYGLLASGIAMAIVWVVNSIGSALEDIFTDVQSGMVTGT